MMELLGPFIGFALALLASKWRYGRQLLALAKEGLGIAKATGLDTRIPDEVRRVAEQAIIAANQREMERLVDELMRRQRDMPRLEAEALERGKAMGEGMEVEIVPLDGSETWERPFKDGS